jgi:hypothetical protein
LEAIKGSGAGGFNEKQAAVWKYVDALTESVQVPDEVFSEVKKFFSEVKKFFSEVKKFFSEVKKFFSDLGMLELMASIAGFNTVTRIVVGLDAGELNGKSL